MPFASQRGDPVFLLTGQTRLFRSGWRFLPLLKDSLFTVLESFSKKTRDCSVKWKSLRALREELEEKWLSMAPWEYCSKAQRVQVRYSDWCKFSKSPWPRRGKDRILLLVVEVVVSVVVVVSDVVVVSEVVDAPVVWGMVVTADVAIVVTALADVLVVVLVVVTETLVVVVTLTEVLLVAVVVVALVDVGVVTVVAVVVVTEVVDPDAAPRYRREYCIRYLRFINE